MEFLHQGAEAKIWRDGAVIIKERVKKTYRHECIDLDIRKTCTRKEAKLLKKAAAIVHVPAIIDVSEKNMTIRMEWINGEKLRDTLANIKRKEMFQELGEELAKLHDSHIIHGDLTTSNILISREEIYFIDFGLGGVSTKIEDKAVDLHLARTALESKHPKVAEECFSALIKGYKKQSKDAEKVMERLEKVEKRGRYKGKQK